MEKAISRNNEIGYGLGRSFTEDFDKVRQIEYNSFHD